MVCSKCGFINDPDADFCENCGSSMVRTCSTCGAALKPETRFCKKCGAPAVRGHQGLSVLQQAAPSDLQEKIRSAAKQVEGQRKSVTILFADIVGSTALAEKLDPEEWKEIVSGAHKIVSQAVYRYEGTIAQLLGDGVLAFFGAPITHEDDPLRAVLAALEIQRSMAEYERQLQGCLESFQMRIGLNTGLVVVGSVGSDLHMEYLAVGDAVNLAARLQAAAEPGQVLISESTARLVRAACELQPLGEISVKGKAEPVAVFAVSAVRIAPKSRRGFEELRSPLVGRDTELAALQHAFEQLRAGLGQIVSITGEAGIGKSRLVEEACRTAGQKWMLNQPEGCQNLHWLEGRALSYGQKLSFWMIRQLIQNDLGLLDGDPEIKIRLALRRRLQALFGENASQMLPYLGVLLGVRLEGEAAEQVHLLDGETLRYQTLLSITRYFSRLAKQQPTVLVLDDLHWADPSSLEALDLLLPVIDHEPLMILLLSRQEREHGSWRIILNAQSEYTQRYTGIALRPLSEDEQNRLVDNLLAIVDLPAEARERILERAEGNPLFLEEIVHHLIEQGAIVQEGERWRATGALLEVIIPDTLRGVLLARIDRLQEDVRRTLQLAAVIGKSFLYSLLAAIAEAQEQLEGQLALLQRADLVREKARLPELEYMFKHSLTQEATYQSLLLEQRREFHGKVGQALESLFAERKEEYYGLLAHHFDAAGDTEKAVTYLTQAGDRARLSDEHMEAVGYYQRAVELLEGTGDGDRLARVWLKLGLVYHDNFQFEATYQAYEHAFSLTQKTRRSGQVAMPGNHYSIRLCEEFTHYKTFDPGKILFVNDARVVKWLFSGLAQVDEELNVIPDVARSWQVLAGGQRYLFHLRDDVRWTDGIPVTARDFAWAWKRNLHPSIHYQLAQVLFDVVGAQEYHQGYNPDPDCIGVRALDDLTLEVRLVKPVAHFPYIVTFSRSFPLPRAVIERYGDNWWHPEHIVTNGAYRLVDFNPATGFALERNPDYHGEFPGNVHRIESTYIRDPLEGLRAYQENRTDIFSVPGYEIPGEIPTEEQSVVRLLGVKYIVINPKLPPFDDLRLRRALQLSLDQDNLIRIIGFPGAHGGMVPPGMAGHSPDLLPRCNLEYARRLLADAGYPDGQGLAVIKATTDPKSAGRFRPELFSEIILQWRTELGILIDLDLSEGLNDKDCSLVFSTWVADYPDPDNFLRQSSCITTLHRMGWNDPGFDTLIEAAVNLRDRTQRMALYRQADRLLVVDQALVLPWSYSSATSCLVKPWVKNYKVNQLSKVLIQNVIIEDH